MEKTQGKEAITRTLHHSPHYNHSDKGNFDPAYHLEMISDPERVGLFKKGIDKAVNEKTVFCDLGCGTGLFTVYAAHKAKKVYAVDYDESILEVARENIEKSGLSDKITLIHSNALSVKLPEKVDVVFCEMLSIWMIEEPEILVMNHAQKNLLKPRGITIPEKVINLAELCNADYVFGGIEMKASIAQFTGIKRPRIMSESRVLNMFSFDKQNPETIKNEVDFTALTSGLVNSVRLASIAKIAEGINFYSTDTLLPLTIVPLNKELYVKEGQRVRFSASYKHRESINNAHFEAYIIS